jgi:Ca2+:H+ antiporter
VQERAHATVVRAPPCRSADPAFRAETRACGAVDTSMAPYAFLALVPLAIVVRYAVHAPAIWTFAIACAAIVPLADWIRRATEQIAERKGGAVGGLLNVTFGNAAELVLAFFVLLAGRPEVVKAQITGAIIGNGLLGFGLAISVGTLAQRRIRFDAARAGHLASLLMLVMIALLLPALFDYTERSLYHARNATSLDAHLSLGVAIVHTLVTHRDVFATEGEAPRAARNAWPLRRSIVVLLIATALTAWMAEVVSDALDEAARALRVSGLFLGVVVLALVGNIAEYLSSMHFARQGRIALVVGITVGSTIQVALLVAPILVIASHFTAHPLDLVFANPLELVAIASTALIVNAITRDGEATWFEGVLLVAVYVLLGVAFFYATPAASAAG